MQILSRRRLAVVVVVVGLVLSWGAAGTAARGEGADAQISAQGVRARDDLIAAQEALLNVYRCRYGVDTHVVTGGCSEGRPTAAPAPPALFGGNPTDHDLAVRDGLIASQEALLNVYRCRYGVDTGIVPGGCYRIAAILTGAIWTMNQDGGDLRLIADPQHEQASGTIPSPDTPVWSPDGGWVAYAVNVLHKDSGGHSKRAEVWIAAADGTAIQRVFATETHERARIDGLSWSPDGSKLAYRLACCTATVARAGPALWTINPDGTQRAKVTDYVGDYSWSPDGSQIAFAIMPTSQIWVADSNGANQMHLISLGVSGGPFWSPDGTRMAVTLLKGEPLEATGRKEIWVFDSAGQNKRRIAAADYLFWSPGRASRPGNLGLAWSPDSTKIAFFGYTGDGEALKTVDADGENERRLALLETTLDSPDWSPDGKRIAFTTASVRATEDGLNYTPNGLWFVESDGTGTPTQIGGFGTSSGFAWSPSLWHP